MLQGVDARRLDLLRRLEQAERQCARRKRSRPDAIAFRANRLEHLLDLATRLQDGTWRPAPGLVFVTTRPKFREVHAARYEDRVVHHLIMGALAPELDRRLSPACFACRPGKGTHAAVKHLSDAMWRLSRRGKVRVWALQMDVVNFFHSIHRPTLWAQLQRPMAAAQGAISFDLRAAVAALLDDEPGRTARRVGRRVHFDRVPQHKRLRGQAPDCGLPIGNLTSQWFANAYLDPLDVFVTRNLRIPGYVRYVDDFVLIDTDLARLQAARCEIVRFLRDRLHLAVHERPIRPAAAGIDFAGTIVRPQYRLLRRRTVAAWRRRLRDVSRTVLPHIVPDLRALGLGPVGRIAGPCAVWPVDGAQLDVLRQAWASGVACTGHTAGKALAARAWSAYPLVARYLARNAGRLRIRLGDPCAERGKRIWADFAAQKRALAVQAGEAILLMEVGRFLRVPLRRDRRRLGLANPGACGMGPGVPRGQGGALVAQALAGGWPVAIAVQTGEAAGDCMGRILRWWVEPLARTAAWWRQRFGVPLDMSRSGRPDLPAAAGLMRRKPMKSITCPPPHATAASHHSAAEIAPSRAQAPTCAVPQCNARGQYELPFAPEDP